MQFDIVANDKATAAMGKVERSADGFGKKLSGSLTMAAAKAAAILATIQKLGQVIGEQVDVADEAAKLGVSIETYQRLKFAAEQYNASVEDVAKGLVKVNNVLDEAATKGGPNAEVLRALGFAQEDITNRAIKTEEVYKRLAEAIAEAGSEEEKFALASRVFGDRMAQTMVPILADFATFNAMQGKVLTMTDENAKALDNFSERLALASTDAKNLFGGMVGSAIRGLGLDKPIAAPVPEADKEAQRARGKAARDALLKAGAPKAAMQQDQLTMAAIGGASAQTLRGIGTKRPEEETAENTRRLVELAAGGAPVADTGSTRGFTEANNAGLSIPGRVILQSPNLLKTGLGMGPNAPRPAR